MPLTKIIKTIKIYPLKVIIAILFNSLFSFNLLFAQENPTNPTSFDAINYQKDFDNLYETCAKARPDTVTRLLSGFLHQYKIHFDYKQIPVFCKKFKEKCLQNDNKILFRRASIFEIERLFRGKNATGAEAEKAFNVLYDNAISNNNDYSAALQCLHEIAQFHKDTRFNLKSIKMLFYAEKFAKKHFLEKDIAFYGIQYSIGYVLWDLEMPENSIKYLKSALSTKNALNTTIAYNLDSLIILNAIGINYQKMNNLRESLRYFEMATDVAIYAKNIIFTAVIKGNAAVTLHKLRENDKAYAYAMEDKNMSLRNCLWENAVGALHWLIRIEIARKNFTHAKILLDSLDDTVKKTEDKHFNSQKRQKEATYLYYQAIKEADKTLVAYKEFVYYDDLAKKYANENKISELQLNAEVRIYEQEMEEKEQEKRTINIIFVVISVLGIVVTTLIIRYLYKKIRKVESDKQIVEKNKIILENINTKQAQEIGLLKHQLFAQIAIIKSNNTLFRGIITPKERQYLDKTEEKNAPITNIATNNPINIEDSLDTESSIDEQINNKINIIEQNNIPIKQEDLQFLREFNLTKKAQWQDFRTSFLKIYPAFEENINKKMGETSSAELRLMMLHKLELNNKEIGLMLLISPDSVRKAKYRLCKKMGVATIEELDSLL